MLNNMKSKVQSLFGTKKNAPDTDKTGQSPSIFNHLPWHKSEQVAPNTHADTPAGGKAPDVTPNPGRTAPIHPAEPAPHNLPGGSGARLGGPTPGPSARTPGPSARTPAQAANPSVRPIRSTPEAQLPNGNAVRIGSDGSIRELRSPQKNMSVHYGMNGSRQIRVEQPDGSRVVLATRGVPYVQKPWNFGSRAFDHRTYVDNGVLTHQFYRRYAFGGTTLDAYAPQRFYSQDFYKWVAKPQLWTPPPWRPTTTQEPWYTQNQGYFALQPSYASPVFWLTDFVLATSLYEAYNAHPLPAQAPPSITSIPAAQFPATPPASASPLIETPIAPNRAPPSPAAATSPAAPPSLAAPASLAAPPSPAAPAPTSTPASSLGPLSVVAPRSVEPGPSPTIWERFINFFRDLFGRRQTQTQTPIEPAPSPPEPAASPPAPPVASDAAPITDDVKNKVAEEIQVQLAEEAHEAEGSVRSSEPKAGAGGVVEELSRPAQHVFVVASDLDLVDDNGRRCMISEGDVIQILSAADPASGTAQGIVLSSKGGVECALSAKVDIAVSDLQEMQNHMRATIDQGLANTPKGATEPTVVPAFAQAAPPPDPDANSEIENQKTIAASVN